MPATGYLWKPAAPCPYADVDPRVFKIVDLKTPGSGEVSRNLYDNIPLLLPHDEVKFVICDRRTTTGAV